MPGRNDRSNTGPSAFNVLTITAVTLGCLMVGAYLIYTLVVGSGKELAAPLPAPRPPKAAATAAMETFDYQGSVRSVDGGETGMAAFRGQVVFLNFWASWCPPCIVELPAIQRLVSAMAGADDIAFLMVSTEDPKKIQKFMAERGYDFPAYIGDSRLLEAFRVKAYPATFILDRDGRIIFQHMGAARWDDPAFMDYLKGLARTPA